MNIPLLEMKMKQANRSNEDIAKRLNIDPATFYRKKKGDTEFTRKELQGIRAELCLTQDEVDAIFFTD